VITREFDAAPPQLFQARTTNEKRRSVLFELPGVGQDGDETVFFTITLTNATVSGYRMYVGPLPEGGSNLFELEDVTLSFQQAQ
jgi:type VI secretion system Hcp family effector